MTKQTLTAPVVGVGLVIFHKDNVLLIKRGQPPKKGEWSIPGGKQKLGETLEQAALREAKEETGLDVKIMGLIDVVDFIHKEDKQIAYHYSLIDYWAIADEKTPQAGSDVSDAQFYSLDQALALPLWNETKRILRKAAELKTKVSDDE